MSLHRVRGVLNVTIDNVPGALARGEAVYGGLSGDTVTYGSPSPALPAFKTLLDNATAAQVTARKRTAGAAATRDVEVGFLIQGMKSELFYVQSLADLATTPERAVALFTNAGMLVAGYTPRAKPLLELTAGAQPGTVQCEVNVGLLVGVGVPRPRRYRCFNWGYTLDGSKSFIGAPTTPVGRTLLSGLPSQTVVGVRVSLSTSASTGAWSQVVNILVH